MDRITFRCPDRMYEDLERKVERGEYANISEAVRAAVRDMDGVCDPEPPRSRVRTDGGWSDGTA